MSVCVNQMIPGKGLNKFMRLDEKTMLMQKQGNIVNTILGDKKSTATTTSLSSNKWLPQNVLFPMKKTASSEKLPHSKEHEPLDVWSSILNQTTNDESSKLSVPYIVKSSKSCMSEKSLEICTESLGSETGSDGFRVEACDNEKEEVQISNYNYTYTKKSSLKPCFPPPLPSLSFPSLQMRHHRDNGRLLLQAVSVTSRNNFLAKRQNGRLVLTFACENEEEKDYVEKEDADVKLIEQTPMLVPRLALTLVVFNAYEYYWRTMPLGNAALLPSHEQNNYLSLKKNNISSKVVEQNSNEPKELVVLRGENGDDLVKNFKNCKDFRRSFLFTEPSCIAA